MPQHQSPPAGGLEPAYLRLQRQGGLADRAQRARRHLQCCELCAHGCRVDRLSGAMGRCRTGARARVYSFGPHFGEERPLVGFHGSGTIFLSSCNLQCVFCQNWEISQRREGETVNAAQLAGVMLSLQKSGCHNINLVSPSHVVAQILEALVLAADQGLRLPLVYNSGGYDSAAALALLDGVVDIYMPDMKFAESETARPLLGVSDYAEVNRAAVREMHRQVGDLQTGETGIASRGLLIRHLLLPGDLAGTEQIIAFLAGEISTDTYLNLMDQYRPCYRADRHPPLDRRPSRSAFRAAQNLAREYGLRRLA